MRQFNFALVAATETTFGPEHIREDIEVGDWQLDHTEGNCATLKVDIKHPHRGLFTGPDVWLWFSENSGGTAGAVPRFFGRMVPAQIDLLAEKITVVFVARPDDFTARKIAAAEPLKVLPQYDRVFIDEANRDDPDAVLEGYARDWHFDRVTHEVTTSDVLSGEDGIEEFDESDIPYDSLKSQLEHSPLSAVTIDATVNWTRTKGGTVDMGPQHFLTYSGDGIFGSWPKPGASLGGGWSVASSSVTDEYGVNDAIVANWSYQWQNRAKTHENGDFLSVSESSSKPILRGPYLSANITDRGQVGVNDPFADPPVNIPASRQTTSMVVPLWSLSTTLVLAYNAQQKQVERIRFTLASDLQPIISDPDSDTAAEIISLNGADVGQVIDDGSTAGDLPIGDGGRDSYFPTDRGIQSLEYLLSVAAAHLKLASRVVKVQFDCTYARAAELSCRKNALLTNRRLAGGSCVGKITGYSMQCQSAGNSKKLFGSVTLGCAVGNGASLTEAAGDASYVAAGYVEAGYQVYENSSQFVTGADDIAFTPPVAVANAAGFVFPLTKGQIVVSESTAGLKTAQETAIRAAFDAERLLAQLSSQAAPTEQIAVETLNRIAAAGKNSVANAIKNNPITYSLTLKPVTGEAGEQVYDVVTAPFMIPNQYDTTSDGSTA